MRLARLDLERYGAYEGRRLDFGAGAPDLHLIIGPNEAGKSTLLAAIGDLLFGFPHAAAQDFRFEAKTLRVAATLVHDGRTLEVARRRGRGLKNTLLDPASGTALPDDLLDGPLGGVDRAAFDRLYGLDHEKLRAGGKAILEGRDDAARSLFEAGAGMTAVGETLKGLESECAALFKPSASLPVINRLLRERQEALDTLRKSTLDDAAWRNLKARREEAERRRDALIAEDLDQSVRADRLERLARARAPLRRLADARGDLERLGPLPRLPDDSAARLARARAERATALELKAGHATKRDRALQDLAAIVLPDGLLEAGAEIDALEARRPEIDRMRKDLPGKAATLDQIDAAIAQARAACGLGPETPLPGAGWRRRTRAFLEARRALETRIRNHARDLADNERERRKAAEALAATPAPASLADLRMCLAALSPDRLARAGRGEAAAARAAGRAREALQALDWPGTAEALAVAALPALAEASDQDARARRAREALEKALQAYEAARAEARQHRAKLAALAAGGPLPTPEALAASRARRDAALEAVRTRLESPRAAGDGEAGARLALSIAEADLLADRRDAASRQIAEHAFTAAALAAAEDAQAAAGRAVEAAREDLATAEAGWSGRLARAGLPAGLAPSGFPAWKAERDRVLELRHEAAIAADEHRLEQAAIEAADARLSIALARSGAAPAGDLAARLDLATAETARLEAQSRRRLTLEARLADLDQAAPALEAEAQAIAREAGALDDTRARLLAEGAVAAETNEALGDILETLDEITPRLGARPGLVRDVEGMTRDIGAFDQDVAALLETLCRSAAGSLSDALRRVAAELATARAARAEQKRLRAAAEEELAALDLVETRRGAATAEIDALLAMAGLAAEADLDRLLALLAERAAAAAAERDALAELAEIGQGAAPDDLARAAAEIDPATAAAEREAIEARRRDIAAEREALGGTLRESALAIDRAGTETAAADAQQAVAETRAALGAGADRYIEAAAAAAVLRWLIERHRASAQAPLLTRAGSLFATVTRGAFGGLVLDYGDDDWPRIAALRADGTRVGVEGLSEGTRDQLFLALRLGSLQGRAVRGALPLVCDDLLATSDDDRAGAVLQVLGEISRTLQVIVFTHHDHIEGVARRALEAGAYLIHRLEPASPASASLA
jgi:uncharacterized protein YhaN